MKKIITLSVLIFLIHFANAQVNVQLILDPPQSNLVNDYIGNGTNKVRLIITNMSVDAQKVYVLTEIKRDDAAYGADNTTTGYKPKTAIDIPAGIGRTVIFDRNNYNQLTKDMSGNDVHFIGFEKDKLIYQPSFPEGNYTECVYVYDYATDVLLGQSCPTFSIYEVPQSQITMPTCGEELNVLNAQQPVIIQWNAAAAPNIKYHLTMVEVPEGATPQDAMNNAGAGINVVLNQSNIAAPLFVITQSNNIVWKNGATYALQVQTVAPGFLLKNNGLSDVCSFQYKLGANTKRMLTTNGNNGNTATQQNNGNKSIKTDSTKNHGHHRSSTTSTNSAAINTCGSISTAIFDSASIIHLSDNFDLILTQKPKGRNDSLSGKGTVYVKWLGKIKVRFDSIKINSNNHLCSGKIYSISDPSQSYPSQWNTLAMGNGVGAWTSSKIKAVASYIRWNKINKPLVTAANDVNAMGSAAKTMPIGYFTNGDSLNAIGFTEMVFNPEHAEFDVIASLNTKGIFKNNSIMYGTDAIALEGSGIQFTNAGLHSINGEIKLKQSITFRYARVGQTANDADSLKMTFNTDDSTHIGNGIKFGDPNDFWTYKFDADVQLPKAWLIPEDTASKNVAINFQAQFSKWNDFVLEGNLPACTIPNTNGLGIQASAITFDHSENNNAADMEFPTGYNGQTDEMFTGFFIKDLFLTLPDEVRSYADTTKKIRVNVHDLIIDKHGLSAAFGAYNIINYPVANVGNLGASIDTVRVNFINNAVTKAEMLGQITLPISSSDNVSNAINYKAIFLPSNTATANTSSLYLTLSPNHEIKSKFFGDGQLQIKKTSLISLTISKTAGCKRQIALSVDLNGKLYYPTGHILDPSGSIPLDLDLSCDFEHMGMTYQKNATEHFTFNTGNWSFASPQKKICKFAFTITDIVPKIEPIIPGVAESQYLFKGGVCFKAKMNIGTDKVAISGDAKIDIEGAVASTRYGTTSIAGISSVKQDWRFLTHIKSGFIGVKVEDVHVDLTIAAASIKGNVQFYKNDLTYGNAFKGDLTVKFTTLNLAVQAGAIFGNTKYIPNNTLPAFKYWMVQAQVNLPPPGIVFLPGIAFRGFGAGIYSRMHMTSPTVFNPTTAASSTFGGAVFTPDYAVSVGFNVKAIVATSPKEETFNGSIALDAQFNTNGGMDFIQIDGLFNCGAKIGHEADAFANGAITVRYDFPHKLFDASLMCNISKPPYLSTDAAIQSKLHLDGLQNKWFFKFGTPTQPNGVKVLGIGIHSYLEFGNDIDIPHGFMQETVNGFTSIGHNLPAFSDNATGDNKYQSAKGFAFGVGLNYSNSDSWNIAGWHGKVCGCDRYVRANYSIAAGGEIDASFLQYSGCVGLGKGWRAKASMAVYAGASIGYSYNLPLFDPASGILGSVAASAYATAEFPNPTYFDGQLDGDFSLCDYSVPFHKHFTNGTQCAGTEDAVANQNVYTQQKVSDSLSYVLINNILTPSNGGIGISRTTDFSVLLNYPYNDTFALQEQQSSGQIKVRTFRAFYTPTLTQDSISSATTQASLGAVNTTVHRQTATTVTGGNQQQQITNTQRQQQSNSAATINHSHTNATVMHSSATMGLSPLVSMALSLSLMDAGYDELGAKLFKIDALVNGGIANAPTNALKANTSYKFEIVGALQEKINGVWKPVNHRNTSNPIKQTKSIYFKTNSDVVSNNYNQQH